MDKNSNFNNQVIKKALYLVSTPIGNLGDITLRAIEILRNSDYILCEDTRVAKKILNHYNINTNLISNHKFNEKSNIKKINKLINSKNIVSLISDAGTPAISDPGLILIKECIKKDINIIPIPGPSAVTAAISVSGFSDKFYFLGFISDKNSQIDKEFNSLSKLNSSIVFFISPKKLNRIIPSLRKYFIDRKIVLCREITKFYEEFIRLNINDVKKFPENLKGEITVVISNKDHSKKSTSILSESDKYIIQKLINKLSVKDICKIINKDNEIKKSIIYSYCLNLKK